MKGVLDGMPDDELVALARHFSAQALEPPDVTLDSERAQRGAVLAVRALCGTCHLADYRGRDQIPRLAGQREDYLLAAMRQFRTGVAPGRDTIMSAALHGLSDADLSDLAHYFATYRARAER
jgi:cytochrome c553